jgi:hypothetical protein
VEFIKDNLFGDFLNLCPGLQNSCRKVGALKHGLCADHCSFFLLYLPSISIEQVTYFEMRNDKK